MTGRRVLLIVSGGIAAYKTLDLIRRLRDAGIGVRCVLTNAGARFVTPLSLAALSGEPVQEDLFDPGAEATMGHIALSRAADLVVVAPATADLMARMAAGLANDLATTLLLATDTPVLIAPAMNPRMWSHPATQANLATLEARGVQRIGPNSGDMACGEDGKGRFPALEIVYLEALRALTEQDLAGRKVLLTLGPTREFFDCVRFWSNPSSGTMGASLAVAAWLRGAEVTVVCGPTDCWLPGGITRVDVGTAAQMHEAALDLFEACDWACCTAAVADFRPIPLAGGGKFKKAGGGLSVAFEANPDILQAMGREKAEGQRLAGFAAEAADLEANAKDKLGRKNLDLIVANDVTCAGSGFQAPTNSVLVLDAQGRQETWPVLPKTEVAWRIWDWMLAL